MTKSNKSRTLLFWGVCISYFLLLLSTSIGNALGSYPEEQMRYQIPKFIFENGKLPTLFDTSIYDAKYGFSYAGQPNLAYILEAIVMGIASLFGVENEYLYIPARITSMILGCVFLIIVIKIADEVFESTYKKNIFISIICLWNYTVYIFSYINSDSLMMVGIGIIILSCVRGIKSEWLIKDCIWLAIGNSIILLSYINGGSYSVVCIFIFALSYIYLINKENKYKDMFIKGFVICLVTFGLSGWFYIRNLFLYGSLYGSNIIKEIGVKYGIQELTADNRAIIAKNTMFSLKGFLEWIKGQAVSFCGKTVYKEPIVLNLLYWVSAAVVIVIMLLAILKVVREWKECSKWRKVFTASMALGIVITIGVDFCYSAFVDYIPYYARYLVPMIISLGYFLTQGIILLSTKVNNKFCEKNWIIIVVFMIVMNVVTLIL